MIRNRKQALEALSLSPDAGEDDIRTRIKSLLQKHHPDKPDADVSIFHKVNEAKKYFVRTAVCNECDGSGVSRVKSGRAYNTVPCPSCQPDK